MVFRVMLWRKNDVALLQHADPFRRSRHMGPIVELIRNRAEEDRCPDQRLQKRRQLYPELIEANDDQDESTRSSESSVTIYLDPVVVEHRTGVVMMFTK